MQQDLLTISVLLICNINKKDKLIMFVFFIFLILKQNIHDKNDKSNILALFCIFTIYLQLITFIYNSQCYNYIVNNILDF